MLLNSPFLAYACGSRGHSNWFVCLFIILMLGQSCKESKNDLSGGVNKQQEAIGSIIKQQEVFASFKNFQEAPGSLKKHHEGTTSK